MQQLTSISHSSQPQQAPLQSELLFGASWPAQLHAQPAFRYDPDQTPKPAHRPAAATTESSRQRVAKDRARRLQQARRLKAVARTAL